MFVGRLNTKQKKYTAPAKKWGYLRLFLCYCLVHRPKGLLYNKAIDWGSFYFTCNQCNDCNLFNIISIDGLGSGIEWLCDTGAHDKIFNGHSTHHIQRYWTFSFYNIIANIESILLHTGTGCKILQERVIYNKFIEGILTKKIIFLS